MGESGGWNEANFSSAIKIEGARATHLMNSVNEYARPRMNEKPVLMFVALAVKKAVSIARARIAVTAPVSLRAITWSAFVTHRR